MDMKGMMFAGGGLFLSMVVTTIWISGDVSRMREQERAKRDAACAAQAQSVDPNAAPIIDQATGATVPTVDPECAATGGVAGSGVAGSGVAVDPATGMPIDPGAGQQLDQSTSPPLDAGAGRVDPVTGMPIESTTGSGAIDPATGMPIDAGAGIDPATGAPIAGDPAAAGIDPATGLPIGQSPDSSSSFSGDPNAGGGGVGGF